MASMALAKVKREPVEFLSGLKAASSNEAINFAQTIISEAKACGLSMRDYLNWKIDVRASAEPAKFSNDNRLLSGYEAALAVLDLPIRNDFENGVSLQAAASTFQTYPGTRILFPQVVDDVAKYNYRQTSFENVDNVVGNRRQIDGTEVLYMVVNDTADDYRIARAVTERGQVPIHKIQGTEQTVKIYTFGMGWEFTYEFERRASIDLLTPYAQRAKAEVERSKLWMAVDVIQNGDGAFGAAPEVNQSSFNSSIVGTSTNGVLSFKHLLAWLVSRAKAGTPVDTVIGNFDTYIQWLFMFALPSTSGNSMTDAAQMAAAGFQVGGVPILNGMVNFALSTNAPANKLIGIAKAFTAEELQESGSSIEESERSIKNRTVTYVNTEAAGFRLVFGDTRSVYNFGA